MIQELNEKNFDEHTKNGIKFVTFTADWCSFCQKQKPILREIANENIWIGEVNPDKNPNLVRKYGITGFPAFLLFKDGELIGNFAGYQTKYELLNNILSYIT